MVDRYCPIHGTVYFKKGKMRSYAHPIKDEEGRNTGWCNESGEENILPEHQDEIDEAVASTKEKPAYAKPKTAYAPSPEKMESIEGQKSADITAQLWIAGKLKDNDPLVAILYQYLTEKISKDLGYKVKNTTTAVKSTDKQVSVGDIKEVAYNQCKWTFDDLGDECKKRKWHNLSDLTQEQRKELIDYIRVNPKKGG